MKEAIISQGRIIGARDGAFRQSSKSSGRGRHDHGLDVGARRNTAHEKASKDQDAERKAEKEKEIAKRKKESEKRINQMEETESSGTKIRTKIKNVSRPDDVVPTSGKSKLSKTAEIIRKIVEERILFESEHLKSYKKISSSENYTTFKHPDGDTLSIKKDGFFHAIHKDSSGKTHSFHDQMSLSSHLNKSHGDKPVVKAKAKAKGRLLDKPKLRRLSDYKPVEKQPIKHGWVSTFNKQEKT